MTRVEDASALSDGARLILQAIEQYPATLREGSDSLVVLYVWRRSGRPDQEFGAALRELLDGGLVDLMPGEDMRIRLTRAAFEWLDPQIAVPALAAQDDSGSGGDESESAWTSGDAPDGGVPMTRLREAVVDIYRVLDLPPGRHVAAGTLARIWKFDRRRGSDLRLVLDDLQASGHLSISRGRRTAFALNAEPSST